MNRAYIISSFFCIFFLLVGLLFVGCKKDGEIYGTLSYTDYYDNCVYPAGSAQVYRVRLLNGGVEKNVSSATTDYKGNFSFKQVESGTWLLKSVYRKEDVEYRGISDTIYIKENEVVNCVIGLKKTGFTY